MRSLGKLNFWASLIGAVVGCGIALAQNQRFFDRPPFDQVILNEANGGTVLDVKHLDLPSRPLPTLPSQGKLTVQLLDRPTESFQVDWSAIAHVRVYEQILLEEAQRLVAAADFDAAYDYFARLYLDFPNLPGLDDDYGDYLLRNAVTLYQAKQYDRALALLLTLYQRNPRTAGLPTAVERVAGEIIQQYLREQNYSAARAVLDLWRSQFRGVADETAAAWQRRFETAAEKKLGEAQQLAAGRQFIPARKAAEGALAIWPTLEPATAVLAAIQREFPFVTVAVLETAPRHATRRIDDWAALRASRLIERQLAEQIDFGSEGGVYQSPFGQWNVDESGLVLSLKLSQSTAFSAAQLARYFLRLVDPKEPAFRHDLANLLASVSITNGNELELHWMRPHVRPEALLQFPPPNEAIRETANSAEIASAPRFSEAERGHDQVSFLASGPNAREPSKGLQAIIERTMPNDAAAVAALVAGEVDVLDRVPPWRIEQLRATPGVSVQSYRLPTVHVLIPNLKRPLLAKREFRRALCFGIDRKWIVERVLLAGAQLSGYEVVSGPFPMGMSLSDPVRYGYNNQLAPRPFEPRLAAILATVGWSNVQTAASNNDQPNDKKKDEAAILPDIPELLLAHPADPQVRVACQSIELQLEREGIPIKLQEFSADDLLSGTINCDLRYAELAVWEPVTDARLIVGPGGLADIGSPYLNAALRRLDEANNWKEVRSRLAEIHEIAHHELPVIPLWQTSNYFAHRAQVRGIGESPLSLYQHVGRWTLSFGGDAAQASSKP